jgi:bifunctional non-homologous end joining protein LigD
MTRILFPGSGFTTDDAVAYYRAVSRYIVPHLKSRPLSFRRYPATINLESFWEKDAPSFTPEWVTTYAVPRASGESEIHYIVANSAKTLTWLASIGAIELHPFLHMTRDVNRPTSVVFDLDPGPGTSIVDCCEVAIILRDALEAIDLKSFAKVSGSKGVQVYVPLNTPATHDQTETFARILAEELARRHPKKIVAKMTKSLRAKRVFIDWSQNADYKTTVAVYSLRAKREEPYVSMPLTWAEVERARNLDFTPAQAIARVKKRGDLFAQVLTLKQKLRTRVRGSLTAARDDKAFVYRGIRLPKAKSQGGRRLFLLMNTESGNELWLDMLGRFKRWILRPDREGGPQLIASPAGDFPIDKSYYRGEVPDKWKRRSKIDDAGAYEVARGSYQDRHFDLWFTGRVLQGEWELAKISNDPKHHSWRLSPKKAS